MEQVEWRPHAGPQTLVLQQPQSIFEILYGGARGGGKTDAGLAWLMRWIENPRYRALILRKNNDDLVDWLDRAGRMYKRYGAEIVGRPAIIRFPSGAQFRTGHLKDRKSYEKYLGHEYQKMLIEELTEISEEKFYVQILGSCRSTVDGLKPQMFATTNPGSSGHSWVKKRFVDHYRGTPKIAPDTGRKRIFIQSTVEDNPTLLEKDPDYVKFLDNLKEKDHDLWRAWRLGDWDVFYGQVFDEWLRKDHVSKQFGWSLDSCEKIIGFDWGYHEPAVAIWVARSPVRADGVQRLWAYREVTLNKTSPKEWADLIQQYVSIEPIDYITLPHDCFATPHGGDSIADIFTRIIKAPVIRGNTQAKGMRRQRVALTHQYLAPEADGRPKLIVHPGCTNLIETLPALVHAERDPEDVEQINDHFYDSLSYALVSLHERRAKSGTLRKPVKLGRSSPIVTNKGVIGTDIFEEMKKRRPKRRNPFK